MAAGQPRMLAIAGREADIVNLHGALGLSYFILSDAALDAATPLLERLATAAAP